MNSLDFLGVSQAFLTVILVVSLRIGAAVSLVPALGERSLPARVKLSASLLLAFAMAPWVASQIPHDTILAPTSLLQEIGLGLALGFSLRLFVMALQIGGTMAAQSTSLSQLFSGASAEASPAIANLLYVSALALAMILDLPERMIAYFAMSYEAFPIGAKFSGQGWASWGAAMLSNCFQLAFVMAAPFLALSFIYNLALGVINRAMPQLMVAFVGAPLITAVGILFFAAFVPAILMRWWTALAHFLEHPGGLLP